MIRTERLLLRDWRDDDLEPFAALNADPGVMRYFPSVLDRTESDALARRIRTSLDSEEWGLWAVEVANSGDFDHPRIPEGHPLRSHVLYRSVAPDGSRLEVRTG